MEVRTMSKHFLFAHFIGEQSPNGEQVYFSVSKDGLYFDDLNNGKPVLLSNVGEKGVRDPFIVNHPKTGIYYLFATDLSMHFRNHNWSEAVRTGSKDVIVWESCDLIHWTEPRAVTVGIPEAGCVWAPEAIYDKQKEAFLVFWASTVKEREDIDVKHHIYASYTNDFKYFSEPVIYIEKKQSVIDTTIIHTNQLFYRFTKDEESKCIILDKGQSLTDKFEPIYSAALHQQIGLEGPQCYPLPNGKWCLIADRFAKGLGYVPFVIDDLDTGDMRMLSTEEYDFGETKKRHGSVVVITEKEYNLLKNTF